MKIIVSFLLLSISSASWACSSSNHRHLLKIKKPLSNDVETYPKLFTFIDNSDHNQIKSVCPKPRPSRTCQMIRINFEAFKSRKMKFDFDQSNSATLKKTTEEGLDLVLGHEMKGATATLTYKYDEEDVVFILQENVVFGAVHHGSLGKFTIKPCPKGNEECHLLIHKLP